MATTIYLTNTVGCNGLWLGVCMTPASPQNNGAAVVLPSDTGSNAQWCNWTGGYSQGTTTITLSGCPNKTGPPINKMLILDQANDTTDTNGIYICDSSTRGCTVENPGNLDGRVIGGVTYSQKQIVYVTAVSGSGTGPYTVTISPGVHFNNIRPSQSPGAWWSAGQVQNDGLENITIDHSAANGIGSATVGNNAGAGYAVNDTFSVAGVSGSILRVTSITTGGVVTGVGVNGLGAGATVANNLATTTLTGSGSGLTVNVTGLNALNTGAAMFSCYQCWVKNMRSIYAGRDHVFIVYSANDVVRDSYMYQASAHGSQSYAVEVEVGSGILIENNIFQQTTNSIIFGQASGSVVGYNYSVDNQFGTGVWAQTADAGHNAGNDMNLWEGNNFYGLWADDSWGASNTSTYFRNMFIGWQSGKSEGTYPVSMESWVRAFNVVGNVIGQPGYHTNYESYATSSSGGVNGGDAAVNHSIYALGWTGNASLGACNQPPICDALVRPTLMRWGNYDVVTSGAKWDSTEAAPAAVPYVNANFTASYFSSLAHTLPASLYYSSKPSWWPSAKAWPPVGPDVSSGNLGICSGTYAGAQATASGQCTGGSWSSGWAAHANSIPAQDCYLNVMHGPPDGTGNVLNFDASLCYAAYRTGPASPTGLTVTVH